MVEAVSATMKVGRRVVAFVWRYRYPNVFEFFVCFSSVTDLKKRPLASVRHRVSVRLKITGSTHAAPVMPVLHPVPCYGSCKAL